MSLAIKSAKETSLAMGVALRAAKEALGEEPFLEAMLALIALDAVLNHAMLPATDLCGPRILTVMNGPDRKCLAAHDDTLTS